MVNSRRQRVSWRARAGVKPAWRIVSIIRLPVAMAAGERTGRDAKTVTACGGSNKVVRSRSQYIVHRWRQPFAQGNESLSSWSKRSSATSLRIENLARPIWSIRSSATVAMYLRFSTVRVGGVRSALNALLEPAGELLGVLLIAEVAARELETRYAEFRAQLPGGPTVVPPTAHLSDPEGPAHTRTTQRRNIRQVPDEQRHLEPHQQIRVAEEPT